MADAPDEVELKCTHCGSVTTKVEPMKDNAGSIAAAVGEISEDVVAAVQKGLDAAFKKAFR